MDMLFVTNVDYIAALDRCGWISWRRFASNWIIASCFNALTTTNLILRVSTVKDGSIIKEINRGEFFLSSELDKNKRQ